MEIAGIAVRFQTNSREVEAKFVSRGETVDRKFQTNSREVEAVGGRGTGLDTHRFRRTLVRLKRTRAPNDQLACRFQTNSREVEAAHDRPGGRHAGVSDELS